MNAGQDRHGLGFVGQIDATLRLQKEACMRSRFPGPEVRKARLASLEAVIIRRRAAIEDALDADFGGRSRDETLAFEIFSSIAEIRHARRRLASWMKPRRRAVELTSWPAKAEVIPQPLGVVGIVVPWNYPLYLAVSPLVSALAAGNRAMLKLSEHTPKFSALFAGMMEEAFNEDEVAVILGDVHAARAFCGKPFDHLLFTGSTSVGREVMAAAARNLTPVTLELGGKCPVVVTPDANLQEVAERVMFGKLCNAGQTCVAPDYVLLPRGREAEFAALAHQATMRFYPTLQSNPEYTSIINEPHAQRLRRYIGDAQSQGARVHALHDEAVPLGSRKFAPLAFTGVTDSMLIMQDEIFGPLLPLVPYDSVAEAIGYVNRHPRPLALYVFGRDRQAIDAVLGGTVTGGAVVNDVMMQVIQNDLPFGGVGASGMGHYHGREGFDTFSKLKAVFRQSAINGGFLLRPPRHQGRLRRMVEMMIGR